MRDDATRLARAGAFAREHIGKPWEAGAGGPDAFDCWGLARAAQDQIFETTLPEAGIAADEIADLRKVIRAIGDHPARDRWIQALTPKHGDLVTLAHHRYPSHVGVYLELDGGGILHTTREEGVSFDTEIVLKLKGFARAVYYRYVPSPPGFARSGFAVATLPQGED